MADDVAAGDHGTETEGRAAPGRSRPDKESVLAALTRHKSGAAESVPDAHEDDPAPDGSDDHGDDEAEVEAPKPKRKAKPVEEPEDEPEPEAEEEVDEDPIDELEAEADEPDAAPEPEEPKPDPELERRAAQLRKQEARQRAFLSAERAKIEAERRELAADRAEVERYKAAAKRAKFDPTGALRALGLTDDDLEPAARHIYAQTKEAAKDPKNREAADRLMRERELQARIEEQQARLDAIDEREKQAATAAAEQRAAVKYITGVSKAAKPGTLAAHFLAKGGAVADKVMMKFAQIAQGLAEDGELPDQADVLAEYERVRREELEEAEVDVNALLKRKPAPAVVKRKPGAPAPATAKPVASKPKVAAPVVAAPKPKYKDADERNSSIIDMIAAQRQKGKL